MTKKRWPQVGYGPKANMSRPAENFFDVRVPAKLPTYVFDDRPMTQDELFFEQAVIESNGHPIPYAHWSSIMLWPERRQNFMKYAEQRANSVKPKKAEPWKNLWSLYLAKKLCA